MEPSKNDRPHRDQPWDGIGIGIFAVAAGGLLLAEQFGWISDDVKWGGPLLLLVFGISILFRFVKRK